MTALNRKLSMALLFMMIISMVIPHTTVLASEQSLHSKTIRIGYIDYEFFFHKQEDGTFTGYGAELLDKISEYTGWNYEFVFDSFTNQMENLKNGKIDFFCHAQKTEERQKEYLYSDYSTGVESSVLYVRPDDNRFYYNDYQSLNGITIGFLQGSYQTDEFVKYADEHHFTYDARYFATQTECFQALDAGQLDAIAMGSLGVNGGYKIINVFDANPFFFITGKQNQELLCELDSALGKIFVEDPTYTATLYDKYYSTKGSNNDLLFTREEADYIRNSKALQVGLMSNRSPLAYKNQSKQAAGIYVDLMELIAKKSGLQFEYQFLDDGQTGMDYLQNCDGDLVASIASSAFSKINPALIQSNTMQKSSVVFVGRTGMEFDPMASLTVALPAGFINGEEVVSEMYPNFKFCSFESNQACLLAIRDGKADVMLQNLYVIRECLQSPIFDELEIFPAYEYPENEKILTLPENDILISIINKTLKIITEDEISDIVINNTIGKPYHASIKEIIYKYHLPLIGIVVLLLTVFGLIIAMMLIRQRNYQAMRRVNTKLETSNLQLRDAVKQADRANVSKSQFLARMSHEIRTPMNAIVGITTIAESHLDDEERMRDYLKKIETSSHVLLNIINDVLDMSAIESEKIKFEAAEFDLEKLMDGIFTIYNTQCKDKDIQLTFNVDLSQRMLIGDGLRINQVLLNLISNAFKFTSPGGKIDVSVMETERREDNVYVRFIVSDTGCGVSKEMMGRIFKPFEQESSKTAQEHGGSGLGLSIAKNLVEMMHGAIGIESEKGKGTTFTVDLPLEITTKEHAAAREDSPDAIDAIGDQDKVIDFTGHKLLLAEDNELNREIAIELLHSVHMQVDWVTNGQEAVERFAASEIKEYDMILMDIQMPLMDGYEATKKIRTSDHPNAKEIQIIAMTANAFSSDISAALSAGMNGHLAKPIDTKMMFSVIEKCINQNI